MYLANIGSYFIQKIRFNSDILENIYRNCKICKKDVILMQQTAENIIVYKSNRNICLDCVKIIDSLNYTII